MTTTAVPVTTRRAAEWHELAIHAAAQPGLAVLLSAALLARPLRKLPGLGWVVPDARLAREIHGDSDHFSIVHDGASGHWWGQMLGDFVYDRFEGPNHTQFRGQVNDLFTRQRSEALVERAVGPMLSALRTDLAAGRTVDIARFSRIFTTRIMIDQVGLPVPDSDEPCLELFHAVEQLADLGKGNWATTVVPPRNRRRGRALAARIGAGVAGVYDTAGPDTAIGRCRELGFDRDETRGVIVLLIVAGTVTLASTMGRLVALLHDTGSHQRLLADPGLIPDAIREGLRVTSSMPIVGRGVTADVELAGRQLRAGDRVKIMTWSIANSVGRFDLDLGYVPETRQLWFGGGKHMCPGAALTHIELTRFLEALLAAGRPWSITKRRYRINAFVPIYRQLDLALA
ncbi:cytochrome P450 [Nocardia huaxiensis]|uniref:Cytochrome P450 n=1 Tax=Nocardia huaxiensis TaxID=2755382 RepID=A0A7D6VB73_9NOCA|nr:cytochrome P450 [Nocardia huaxiensis]QLY28697.1 cytochrome P450 [Nocardia huaxiensis]UFS97829.1 cytochrome P450 [Nocardia huaxiensis]